MPVKPGILPDFGLHFIGDFAAAYFVGYRMLSTQPPPAHVLIKTAFISDVHLGSPHSTAGQATVDFLTYIKPQTLYVLGDLFDGQEMSQNPHWTRHNEEAVQRLSLFPAIMTCLCAIF